MSAQKATNKKIQTTSVCTPFAMKDLPENFSRRRASQKAFSVWVRQLLLNGRQGTVHAKTRSEMSRTGKKPWKQKGTGRARSGSACSPVWRGGAACFGPQARVRTLDVNRKSKRGVLNALLHDVIGQERLLIGDWAFTDSRPRTKDAVSFLKQAGVYDQLVTLFVASDDFLLQASFANIPNVQMVLYDAPNVYELVSGKVWIAFKKDLGLLTEMVEKWN
jgi:large subunit ribosomal protein L4